MVGPLGLELMRVRRMATVVGAVVVVALGLGLSHARILTGVARLVAIRHAPGAADLLLPLYHDDNTVPFATARLYRQGYAPRVILPRMKPSRLERLGLVPPRDQVWRAALEREGVPPAAILPIGSGLSTTIQLGPLLATSFGRPGSLRIIVVASTPFSRLARADLGRDLDGARIEFLVYPVDLREFDERTWWRSRAGWTTYFDAYLLLGLRLLRT